LYSHAAGLADRLGVGVAQRAGAAQAREQNPHLAGIQRRGRLVTLLQRVAQLDSEHLGQPGQRELMYPQPRLLVGDPAGQLRRRQRGGVAAAEPVVVEAA
jgi:hypothetical protein